jgi:hypothetical protein
MDSRGYRFTLFTLGRCPRFTVLRFTWGRGYVVLVLRCPRFTLSSFYVGTLVQVYVGTVLRLKRLKMGRGYVKRVLRWDVGTFRPPLHYLTLFSCDRNWRSCGKYTRDNFSVVRDNF